MATYTDDFNRADSDLSPGNWVNRSGAMAIESNQAYPSIGDTFCTVSYTTSLASNDMEVAITLGTAAGTPGGAWVVLGADSGGDSVFLYTEGGSTILYRKTGGWNMTSGLTSKFFVSVTFTTGDTLGCRRVGNLYTGTKNGADISGATWTDTGNDLTRDVNHRLVGMGSWASSGLLDYQRINSWSAKELLPSNTPRSMFVRQARKRSYFY